MERKLGEIFTYNGKIYQVVKSDICANCAFRENDCSILRSFIDKKDKLNVRRDELLQEMKQFQEDYIKALPVKIGDKIMDEDGRVGQLSRIVPYRSPSERFMCATLSLTLFFHMEKKDGTYDNREVYVHGFPIKL